MYRNPKPAIPAPPPEALRSSTHLVVWERAYSLITPLFGGGVEPQQWDPISVVRTSSVRGQLRFWWRATRGGSPTGDLADMRDREASIWGAASTPTSSRPSRVQVEIVNSARGTVFQATQQNGQPAAHVGHFRSVDSYVAFPLQQAQGTVQQGVTFTLRLSFPASVTADVAAALWAWETFGGLGARTRRGFGALQLTQDIRDDIPHPVKHPQDLAAAEQAIQVGLATHVLADARWPSDVPHLLGASWRAVGPRGSAVLAWRHLIGRLKAFRHQRPNNGQGRNRWPEPDEIRRLTRRSAPNHAQPVVQVRKFPRAQFGLPILFQFRWPDQQAGDPAGKNQLSGSHDGTTLDRLASPLILRPLALKGGQAVGVALRLRGVRLPDTLRLQLTTGSVGVRADLDQTEANAIANVQSHQKPPPPALTLAHGNAPTDLIEAFLKGL